MTKYAHFVPTGCGNQSVLMSVIPHKNNKTNVVRAIVKLEFILMHRYSEVFIDLATFLLQILSLTGGIHKFVDGQLIVSSQIWNTVTTDLQAALTAVHTGNFCHV